MEPVNEKFMNFIKFIPAFLNIRKAYLVISLYTFIILFFQLHRPPIWHSDSYQYLSKSIIRPPLYPIIIDFFKMYFGASAFEALIVFQILFVFLSALYLSQVLRKRLDLHPITFTCVYILLSSPLSYLSVMLGIYGNIGNRILTEALTYGFFLLTLSVLLKALYDNNLKNLIIYFLLMTILLLIRPQMILMYVVTFFLIILLSVRFKKIFLFLSLTSILIFTYFLSDICIRQYNKLTIGYYGKIHLSSSHLVSGIIFVSDGRFLNLISDNLDREVLHRSYYYLENHKMLAKYRTEAQRSLVDFYNNHFGEVLYKALLPSFLEVHSLPFEKHGVWDNDALIQFESFADRVLPVLLTHYFREYSKLMLLKFLYSFNFREGFFIASLLLFPFVNFFNRELKLFAFLVIILLMVNRLMMTPIIYLGDRYLFYTDILEYVVLVSMAEKYLSNILWFKRQFQL